MSDENISVLTKVKNQKDRKVQKINGNYFKFCFVVFVFNHFLQFLVAIQLLDINIEEIVALEKENSKLFSENTNRKTYFF